MKTEINKKVFNSLMEKLNINEPKSEKENFDDWMRNKVKSIYYADNSKMIDAYSIIEEKYKLVC